MLRFVSPGGFILLVQPKSDGVLHYQSQDSCPDRRVEQNRARTDGLAPQLIEAATVEEAGHTRAGFRGGNQPDEQGADDAADQVDTHHVERIVISQFVFQPDSQGAQRAGDGADDERSHHVDRRAGRGDRDQAGHDARGGTE